MPEGDTIHRAASALRTALVGKRMLRFDAPRLVGPVPRAGRVVERVSSHGKHLEIVWDDGLVLHTHMRMSGSWHLYHRGDPWRRPHHQMRAAIEVEDWLAVCFNAPTVETFRVPDKRRHPGMGRLGPDLCDIDSDLGEVVNLILSYPDPEARLGDVLLDQRVMCGVGNVYRCEVLWATELSPFAPVGALSERDAIRVINTAASMLRANLHHARRVTAPGLRGGLGVYGRVGSR
jgi:endonuclease-8